MDFIYPALMALLWGLAALLAWGLRKLERPQGGRP